MSKRECVKVANLRKTYGTNITLEKWLLDPNNVYVGRHGRISIDKKYVFVYKGSKWANPFKLSDYTLEECLIMYREYILKKITNDPKNYDINELNGKNLGCWCTPESKCHVDVLLSLLQTT